MIGLTIPEMIFVFITGWLMYLAFLWTRAFYRIKRHQWSLNDTHLFNCDECHYAFITKEAVNLTRCPRCNTICILRRRRNRGSTTNRR